MKTTLQLTTRVENTTPKKEKTQIIMAVLCLSFFPLMYFIGKTIMSFMG